MTLKEKIFHDFKEAYKKKDEQKKSVLSMIMSEIKNKEITLLSRDIGLTDEQVIVLLRKAVKQREESAQIYRQGKRTELAEKEEAEKNILASYLPQELDNATIERIIREAKEKIGANKPTDMGKLMKEVMPNLKGLADGKRINQMALKVLNENK